MNVKKKIDGPTLSVKVRPPMIDLVYLVYFVYFVCLVYLVCLVDHVWLVV